ncbi:MAG TPA: hypothetical protein VFL85_02365 [Candidatus Saccharimonadales bacterium]|nr:hypothetical protein [Candidatus Saccharimonadales bacterium]
MENLSPDQARELKDRILQCSEAIGTFSVGLCQISKNPSAWGVTVGVREGDEQTADRVLSQVDEILWDNIRVQTYPQPKAL